MAGEESHWRGQGLSRSELEADVAYFDARLALLPGQPSSPYREAQRVVYGEIEAVLSGMLARLRGGPERRDGSAGIEVEEWSSTLA